MKIVVDLQSCQTTDSRQRGIGRYSIDLAKALLRNRGSHDVTFLVNDAFAEHSPGLRAELEAQTEGARLEAYTLAPLVDAQGHQRRRLQRLNDALLNWQYSCAKPDVLHISSVFEGWLTGNAHVTGSPAEVPGAICSATLYDLIPLLFSDTYLSSEVRHDYFAKLGVFHQLDVVLAISDSARQDAIQHLGLDPERVVNIRGATGGSFHRIASPDPLRTQAVLARHGLGARFLLYTSGIDHRKNNHALIDAYALLPNAVRDQVQLAIVCAVLPEQRADLLRYAARRGIAPNRVRFTGYIEDDDLNVLYNLCEVFVFPSLYEGFGLPLLEAMTCGACVAAANTSSLPEIAGRSDILFDPRKPDAIVRVLLPLLESPARRRDLSLFNLECARKFSWDRCASDTIAAFEAADERRRRAKGVRAGGARQRLALFSPLPPQQSGIADYTAALLPHFAQHYEIDLVVDGYTPCLDAVPGAYRVLGIEEFSAHASRYDAIVYHFGNSEFHRYMYDIAMAHPGIVVMHDFFLSGLVNWMDSKGHSPGLFARELVGSHGSTGAEALAAMQRGQLPLHDAIYRFPMSRSILTSARGVIFHSQYASRLRESHFPDLDPLPSRIVPHFAKPARPFEGERLAARAALDLEANDVLVCAFGFLAETKQNHLLLEALASPLLATDARIRMAFVGELPRGDYASRVRSMIHASPHRDRIEITGYASEESYRRHLAACDIAVSLRALSRGETSGALLKSLASGCATIVSDEATMGEFTDQVVRKVAPHSKAALAAALRSLIDDPAARSALGDAAARFVERELHPVTTAQRYATAIAELMALDAAQSAAGIVRRVARIIANEDLPPGFSAVAADVIRAGLVRRPLLARSLPACHLPIA